MAGVVQVVYDETGRVWVMLHSGSRNIGNVTATHYDRLAKAQLKRRRLASPGGLNFFHIESEEGQQYLQVRGKHLFNLPDLEHSITAPQALLSMSQSRQNLHP